MPEWLGCPRCVCVCVCVPSLVSTQHLAQQQPDLVKVSRERLNCDYGKFFPRPNSMCPTVLCAPGLTLPPQHVWQRPLQHLPLHLKVY